MKKRIIALILVVATLALALVSCGYSYTKDDLSQYVTFEKTNLDKMLAALEIEDGDFTSDDTVRAGKVMDYIYETLAKDVKDAEKLTTGTVGANDVLYFNYYMTTVIDGKTVVYGTANMKDGSKATVQLGLSDNKDAAKLAEEAFGGVEFTGAYTVLTSGTAAADKVAFISYVKEHDETVDGVSSTKKETVTYEMVTLGDANHPVAEALKDKTIGTAIDTFNKTVDGVEYTYSKATVNWVVSAGTPVEKTHKPFTKDDKITDVFGKEHNVTKDTEVTYHLYPVNYSEVDEFNATVIITTLLSSFTTTEKDENGEDKTTPVLPCFEGKEELLKSIKELKDALTSAESKLEEAEKAEKTAKEALDKAKAAVKEGETATTAQQETIDKANTAYEAAKADTADKKTKADTAKADRDAKIAELFAVVEETTVETDYKNMVKEDLLEAYNAELRTNLAKAIWKAMQDETVIKVNSTPKQAVQEVYDRMINAHKNTFYNEKDSTNSKTHYLNNGGDFDKYLMKVTKTDSAKAAEAAVWSEAEAYVKPIVAVYYIAEQYGKKLTEDEIKAYKNDLEGNYSYNEYYYGEYNAIAAYQFDTLMNYFLETEVDENGEVVVNAAGVHQYKNIGKPVITEKE